MDPQPDPGIRSACDGMLADPESYPSTKYQGRRVYFCTRACLRVLTENPEAFMNGEVEHPVGDD